MKQFEIGDILFYESDTFVGKGIRTVTKYPFSHVALAVSPTEIVEANAFIKSRKVKFADTEYKRIKVMRLKTPLTPQQKTDLIVNSINLLGRGYDYKGIALLFCKYVFRINLDSLKDDATRLWCTEMVDFIYDSLGIDVVPQVLNKYVSIEDMANSPALFEVCEFSNEAV